MISETLAGTNPGTSEVSLSDTSSSNSHPLNGATANASGKPEASAEHASAGAGEQEPAAARKGWWNRGGSEAPQSGASALVQVGERVAPAPKAPAPDGAAGISLDASTPAEGEGVNGFRENEDQAVVDSGESGTSPAPSANGFAGLGLAPEVLKAVEQSGYTVPTPIQAQGIPVVLQHRDMIGIAQTGTGKTASFTLPMIELLARGRAKARMPRSLILEPTRELAAQVAESFEKYGKYNKLNMALLIGGTSFDDQDKKLDRGVDVLIATPGRLLDHFERGKLMLSQVQILVVDEADRMLDMGFIPDVEKICKLIPFTRQTLFYSATMPAEIRRLTEQFLQNPVKVEVARPATTAENITQEAVDVPASDWAKREALRRLIRENAVGNAIVFCNRKRDVDVVAKSLSKHGFNAAPLHGDLDQSVRTRTLDGFRAGTVQILVASDVAARGLDIPAVSHVFNYDVPYHADDYVHRIGRTGRAGRSGHTYMLVTPRDAKYMEAIERLIGKPLPRHHLEGLAEQVRAQPQQEHSREHSRDRGRRGGSHREHGRRDQGHREHAQHRPASQAEAKSQAVPQPPQTYKPERKQHTHHGAPKAQSSKAAEREPDALQLPAFLLRPVPLPKEKPATAPRKKVPVSA
ncbi:MAG: DEAD/DEAH box helicase [Alphaproteobacteria bacterium]|nr:DEAD/DEAH box helicase [Alphaproteobacteria bacterium]